MSYARRHSINVCPGNRVRYRQHFWARGYFVSTLGRDERAIRAYIRAQEQEDRRQEQLRLDENSHP